MLRKSKILSFLLCFCLLFEQTGLAQVAGSLDISGHIAAFRNQLIQDKFRPLHLRSLGYDNNQNNFRLLLDKGDLKNPKKPDLEVTTKTLLNYFFVGITLPNDVFWVNLRPDSENNIIDPDLATTDVGKILLEADLQLKKDTAKFTSPETPEGKEYWDKLYQKAGELLGYENVTIPTLTRPWIVPGEIIIRETKDNAYIYKATLKVMLEQDYLKDSATYKFDDPRLKTLNEYSSELIRELIIPKLTKEINTSQRYAPLRQVYYSLILAQWFKSRFYGKGGLYPWLIDRRGLQGLTSKTPWSKTTYFKAYQKSFKDGEYNIQQPTYTPYGQTIRSYFSGGFVCNVPIPTTPAPGIASERTEGPTKVTAISGDAEHNPLPRTDTIVGALAAGGNTMDPSETKVTITEEASSPSGLPAGGLQSGASSVTSTATNSEQSEVIVNQASQPNLGAQVSDVKNLDRLLRLLNVLRRSENVSEIAENASDRDIMEFCIKYLESKGLITTKTDEDGNVIITISNGALNHPDETVRRFVEAIQRWVINPEGGVRAVNFQGKDGVWMIVGFESELQNKDTLEHEQQEIKFRKQGLSWTEAHNQAVKKAKNPLPSGSYEKFRHWLENIPQDKLENTAIFLDVIETLLRGLSDSYWAVRKANSDALKALIDAGLVSKEENREEVESMFREVYGRELAVSGSFHYYLKLLGILKDDPVAAYQIFNWNLEELLELFQILNYFVKGVALDPSYKVEIGEKYFLEKELIKSALPLLNNPKACISHLRQKIKITISDHSVRLAIRVYEVASVNAARGLIKALGLDKDNVIILYDKEIDSEQARRFFPGYDIRAFSGFGDRGVTRIEFHDYGNMKIDTSGGSIAASLPYTPFKFNLPERGSEEELSSMRELLGIGSRRVIVIGSPSDAEFNEFIQSYNSLYGNLPYAQRPLLIIGFRQRRNENELRLLGSLSGQSIAVRSDANAALPNVATNNVLVLNTTGELLKMYALADVAIVGNDRNIFEPASQKAAVLYFEGSWQNNKDAKEALAETGAAQVFSRENLERLINALDDTKQMAERGSKAVEAYKKEVQSKAEEFALQIIGTRSQLRDKIISISPAATLNAPEVLSPSIRTTMDVSAALPIQYSDVAESVKAQASGSRVDKKGGIDFRALPIVNQPINTAMLKLSAVDLTRFNNVNLDSEWAQIQNMVNAGIIPSNERIKEYVIASCLKQGLGNQMDKVLGCIADILRMEEDHVSDADVELKDMLVLIEAGKPESELGPALSKIKFSPQEPELIGKH